MSDTSFDSTFVTTKQSVILPISIELIRDSDPTYGMTPAEIRAYQADGRRWQRKQAALRKAGLLDDADEPKKATDCPVRIPLGNYDSTEDARCERKIGHKGPHRCSVEWEPYQP